MGHVQLNYPLLNMDEMCEGLYTRINIRPDRTEKNAIDFVLVNKEMYSWCESMEIDEIGETISRDCSDHSLISIRLDINTEVGMKRSESGWERSGVLQAGRGSPYRL